MIALWITKGIKIAKNRLKTKKINEKATFFRQTFDKSGGGAIIEETK